MDLVITITDGHQRLAIFGPQDRHLRLIRDTLGVKLVARDSDLKISGDAIAVGRTATLVDRLQQIHKQHDHVRDEDVHQLLRELTAPPTDATFAELEVFRRDQRIGPRTDGQQTYVDSVLKNDLTICMGPAGTGKTYLAVATALTLLKRGQLKRLILARPAVEAGEKLGYLPGDLQAKVNPYLRPLFDAMNDMMEFDQIRRMIANDVIEVIPLAFMRGRTLNNSAVILDEAQNTTVRQMLMFLTRLGHHSKMIVTGDDSQIDLDRREKSGLIDVAERLRNVAGVAIVRLDQSDIVRHPLVSQIVEAYKGLDA
ncbi:MAG: PhoH family protein [Phycisphaerae bacterium]|nr:PhoH family protein [Phycisphaerae bacterium]